MTSVEEALLRSLAWHMVMDYPATAAELWWYATAERDDAVLTKLCQEKRVTCEAGRYVLPGYEGLVLEHERRNRVFARKWQRVQRLGAMLRWVPSVRWMAVCNTMAIGNARDEADIDVCIVVHRGTLWLTRAILASLAAILGRRPGERSGERDAWCFSFLLDDTDLSFSRFALSPHDPYLVWWVLRLVPIIDDGVGVNAWKAQQKLFTRYPQAMPWIAWNRKRSYREGVFVWASVFDRWLMRLQRRFGSRALWKQAAQAGTDVVLHEQVIKTHQDDRRAEFRARYETLCSSLGIRPYVDAH